MSALRNDKAIERLVEWGAGPDVIRDWRKKIQSAGPLARLDFGIPGQVNLRHDHSLNNCLAWWPNGIPSGKRIGLVSSRLGHELDTRQTWFTLLRAVCAKVTSDDIVLSSESTAPARFVERCAQWFKFRLLRIHAPEPAVDLSIWLDNLDKMTSPRGSRHHDVFLSPPISGVAADEHNAVPIRDRAIVLLSDQLFALHVRKGGNLHKLMLERLADPRSPTASVFVALGRDLTDQRVARELMDRGAIGWHVLENGDEQVDSASVTAGAAASAAPIVPMPAHDDWTYLTHCTRRRKGPWPDQGEEEFLDDLILSREAADHSPLASLMRIISQKRIVASRDAIRGGDAVVSFTAVPLSELRNLRTFRSHRSRWDFEPYGICVLREWLESRQARPVVYGDETTWDELATEARPFFQLAQTNTAAGNTIDWTAEREWRLRGDCELSDVPVDAALVFVKTRNEAERIAPSSPWPVTLLE